MEIAVGLAVLAGIGVLIFLQFKRKVAEGISPAEYDRLKVEFDRKLEDISDIKGKLERAQSEKDELSGKGKQLYDNFKNLESDLKVLRGERDQLQRQIQEFEANEKRKDKEFNDRLQKLEAAKISLEEERQRVIREDEDRRRKELEERDRMWNDHENSVVSILTDLCKTPLFNFTAYSNTNLPDGFDGSLKPDFMIDFLGQYVIFDAKVSKSKSLQTYVNDQVKKTVDKVKDNDRIYKSIFLVVPSSALCELKSHHYQSEGYSVFVVSPEALPPILASLKRITMYEFAEQMDPQQRENIIQMVAELDFHINLRNAADIILSKMGTEILQKAQKLDPAIAEEVALKKAPMNMKAAIAASEIKKIVSKLTVQNDEIKKMISPRASVRQKDIDDAEQLLSETLF
jgi:hypothetical protein